MLLEKSLPSPAYLREDVFAREREMIFLREWICALREEELQEPGAFKLSNCWARASCSSARSGGELKAHYNVCRHRGARLCTTQPALLGTGNPSGVLPNGTIRCPYHSWTYGLDGRLRSAPHLGDKLAEERASLGLHPIGVEAWGGFVFLNLTPAESKGSLRDQLGSVPGRVARYPLAELRSAHRIAYDVAANWKVIAENYNECYHCGPVHPELCEVVPAFRAGGGANLTWEEGVPHREGAFTFTRSGTTERTPFATLSEQERIRHKGEIVYPNLFLSLSPDHVAAFSLLPEAPGRTRVVVRFPLPPGGDGEAGLRPARRRGVLGPDQPPGLGDLRRGPARHELARPSLRLLRADGGPEPRHPALRYGTNWGHFGGVTAPSIPWRASCARLLGPFALACSLRAAAEGLALAGAGDGAERRLGRLAHGRVRVLARGLGEWLGEILIEDRERRRAPRSARRALGRQAALGPAKHLRRLRDGPGPEASAMLRSPTLGPGTMPAVIARSRQAREPGVSWIDSATEATRRTSSRESPSEAHSASTAGSPRPTISDTAFRYSRFARSGSSAASDIVEK